MICSYVQKVTYITISPLIDHRHTFNLPSLLNGSISSQGVALLSNGLRIKRPAKKSEDSKKKKRNKINI